MADIEYITISKLGSSIPYYDAWVDGGIQYGDFLHMHGNYTDLRIDLTDLSYEKLTSGLYGYSGSGQRHSVYVPGNSCIYSFNSASNSTTFKKFDTTTDTSSTISTGVSTNRWGYPILVDDKIFVFPNYTATNTFLVVDTTTDTVSTITPGVTKVWYNSFLAPNGYIYSTSGDRVVKIDPTTNGVTLFTHTFYAPVMSSNGILYGPEAGSTTLKKFDTATDTYSTSTLSSAPLFDSNYSYNITNLNKIVNVNYGPGEVAIIDPATDTTTVFDSDYYGALTIEASGKYGYVCDTEASPPILWEIDTSDNSITSFSESPVGNTWRFTLRESAPPILSDGRIIYTEGTTLGYPTSQVMIVTPPVSATPMTMNYKISGTFEPMTIKRKVAGVWDEFTLERYF